jgi:hypothetical protein
VSLIEYLNFGVNEHELTKLYGQPAIFSIFWGEKGVEWPPFSAKDEAGLFPVCLEQIK